MPGKPSGKRPGPTAGARALVDGFRFIAGHPACWPWAMVPGAIVALLSALLVWLSFGELGPWLSEWLLPDAGTWYAQGAKVAIRWLASLLAAYLAVLTSIVLAPSLSAPALEHLIRTQEAALEIPARPAQGFFHELGCGLQSQLFALAVTVPFALSSWLLGVLVPVLAPVVLALQVLVGSLAVAWNLLDYPLTLRGVPLGRRLALLGGNASAVIGFGVAFAVLFSVPGAAVALLPVGVVAATRLTWQMVRCDPAATGRLVGTADDEPMP